MSEELLLDDVGWCLESRHSSSLVINNGTVVVSEDRTHCWWERHTQELSQLAMFVINYLQTQWQKQNLPHSVPQFCEPKIQARLDWLFIFHVGLMDSLALGIQDGFPQVWPLGSLCWSSELQGLHLAFPIRLFQWGGWLTYGECCRDSASQG